MLSPVQISPLLVCLMSHPKRSQRTLRDPIEPQQSLIGGVNIVLETLCLAILPELFSVRRPMASALEIAAVSWLFFVLGSGAEVL